MHSFTKIQQIKCTASDFVKSTLLLGLNLAIPKVIPVSLKHVELLTIIVNKHFLLQIEETVSMTRSYLGALTINSLLVPEPDACKNKPKYIYRKNSKV